MTAPVQGANPLPSVRSREKKRLTLKINMERTAQKNGRFVDIVMLITSDPILSVSLNGHEARCQWTNGTHLKVPTPPASSKNEGP